jgi:hypothetical protein
MCSVDEALTTERRAELPVIKLSSPETREFWEVPVLFEDEHLLAIRQAGAPAHFS